MFPNLKSTFGTTTNNAAFGFSTNVNSNPFGQSTFGKAPTTGFGQPSTAFGTTSTPLFGQATQHGSSLFSNPTPATFGQAATTQPTFGGGMFGANTAQPSSSGLFGTANTSTFGQQNKSTGFGFGANTASTGFFGQPANPVQPQQQSSGLFGQTTTNLFGSTAGGFGGNTANNQVGTVIKFIPVTGTDTMAKGSSNQTISTRHHCITCMKEYENKSLEELRWEDYQVNRKGPQQGTQPSGGLFGNISQPVGGGLFGSGPVATSANTLFGQQENKSVFGSTGTTGAFGQTNTGFGAAPATNTSSGGLFAKSLTGFGTNTSTTPTFPFSSSAPQQSTSLFGTSTVSKGFGAQPAQSNLFGQPSGFGTQNSFGNFGQTQNQNVGLFNQNKTTPFMPTSTNNAFGSFGQPTQQQQQAPSLFSGAKTNTGFGGFGVTTTTPAFGPSTFGQPNPSGGLFNTSFNKTPAPLFGQTNTTNPLGGTGLTLGGGNSLFANTTNKPNTMFGTNLGFGSNLGGFGNTNQTTAFNLGGSNVQQGVPAADQSHINSEQQIISMSSTPYGLPSLLNNINELDHDIKDSTRPTNPTELNALLNTVNKSHSSPQSDKLQPRQVFGRKIPMFDGLEHRDESLLSNIRMNNNPKRLIIRNKEIKSILEPNSNYTIKPVSNQSLLDNSEIMKSNKSILEDDSQEKLYPDLRKELSANNITTTPKNGKNDNSSNLPISSTMISSTAKTLFIPSQTSNEEEEADEGELFTEASESQDWQDEHNESGPTGLGVNSDIAVYSIGNSQNTSGTGTPVKSDPTGIILTRAEYYTVPFLDELVKYISEDGTCVVKGFTVGRLGYGNVYFPDAFDVSNLNLDELVHFRHKEINIYPDDSKKPPVGQGLNRKAQVTLDKVWPMDKKAKQVVSDVNSLTKMDYAGRLRRLCEKQNTRFVEYRPDTGSWVFKVEHFSKYGHRDSDEDDDTAAADEADPTKKKEKEKVPKKLPSVSQQVDVPMPYVSEPTPQLSVAQVPNKAPLQDLMGLHEVVDTGFGAPIEDEDDLSYSCMDTYGLFRNQKFSDDISKCTLMKSTFFESEFADYEDSASDVCSSEGGILELSNYVSRSSPKRTNIEDDRRMEEPPLVLDIFEDEVPIPYPEEPECVQLPRVKDYLPRDERYITSNNIADMTAFKGHSFKVGWGRDMTLLCLGTNKTALDYDDSNSDVVTNYILPPSARYITINKITNINDNVFKDCLEKHLTCQLENSKVQIINEVPYFSSNSGCQLLQSHQKLSSVQNFEQQIWDLCLTLWNEIPKEDLERYDNRTIRKRLFSSWIKSVVDKTVSEKLEDPKRNSFSNILTCVSGNRIDEAAKLALESDNINLSLLISQLPSNMSARAYLRKQLDQWNESQVHQYIDTYIWKLYTLFAGCPFSDYGDQSICVYEEMDWMRILAIYFWYIIEPGQSLAHAVNMYEKIFKQHIHTLKPIPEYETATEEVYDLRFQLLKFYSDNGYSLTQVLNPFSHTNDTLDYRLSWFLLETLGSLGHADLSKQAKIFLHTNFAAQLEQMGLWHWSIFVLLFIEESALKKTYIDDILGRHVELYNVSTPEYRAREKMLVHQFKIPSQWIDSKKAILAIKQLNYKEAIYYLCYANKWTEAYYFIMQYMVPDHFLCYDYELLIKILSPLQQHKDALPDWDVSGGLILDFAKLGVQYNQMLSLKDAATIKKHFMNFRAALMNVSSRLQHFKSPTYMHDVCLAEMSGRIAVMLRKLLNLISGHTSGLCVDTAVNAQNLPMTADYLKQELNSILVDFLNIFQPTMIYL